MRAFNLRAGHTKDHDRPIPRYGSTPVDGPSRGKSMAPHWEEMLENHYRERGWTSGGAPKEETLASLGLEWVWR